MTTDPPTTRRPNTDRDRGSARRLGRLLVLALALAVPACGLSSGDTVSPVAQTPTTAASDGPATSDPDPGPDPTVEPGARAARYEENVCPFPDPGRISVTCGTLLVPEERSDPASPTIRLAVTTLHATGPDPRPDPIVYLEGGPGGSATAGLPLWFDSPLLEDRDVILLDQRGTGFSEPLLACTEELDGASENDSDLGLYEACFTRLSQTADLSAYTTAENAADVADLRLAMGLGDVNLLGISYGTRLALVTMNQYPEGIRSVVLDSVFPPGVESLEEQSANAEDSFEALFAGCADHPDCAAAYPDLRRTFYDTVVRLNEAPQEAELRDEYGESSSEEVWGDDLVDAVFFALYDAALIPEIPRAIDLASRGDLDEAFAILDGVYLDSDDVYDEGFLDAVPADQSDGLYYSVTCSEELPLNQLSDAYEAAEVVDPAIRAGLVYGVEFEFSVCKLWPVEPDPLEVASGDVPTLVLAGAYDPITPSRWGQDVAAGLDHARYYEFDGVGHAVLDAGDCPVAISRSFLEDPTSEPDSACLDTVGPPTFEVP